MIELDECIDNMQTSMQDVMARHEMDFLTSYKSHMYRVEKELEKYKKALSDKEFDKAREDSSVKM